MSYINKKLWDMKVNEVLGDYIVIAKDEVTKQVWTRIRGVGDRVLPGDMRVGGWK